MSEFILLTDGASKMKVLIPAKVILLVSRVPQQLRGSGVMTAIAHPETRQPLELLVEETPEEIAALLVAP